MKPLNLDNSPCSPISSNCVIWQGPNIPCIKLCTGDTITDVVYALAMQLCDIVDAVNISTLDLTCLKITTGKPTNINQLLQILINKICETNSIPAPSAFPTRGGNSSCPTDCIVPVPACLQTGTQTTMKLLDYVQMIGNTICSIIDDITTINNSITNITNRVIALESIPPTPPYVLPSVIPDCTLANGSVVAGVSYPLNIILRALINDDNHGYCALLGTTGQPSDITVAFNSQTVSGTDGALSNCALTLDQLFSTTWITTPTNLSESFIDLWLTVQDIRDAYKRYNVTAGNSNVIVTTTTTPGTCGPEVSFAIKAKSSSVAGGTNIASVTTNVVDLNTEYTVNARGTTVAAGTNVTVDVNTLDPVNTIYTVNSKEAIVQASLDTTNTVSVTASTNPTTNDTTYEVYSKYGLDSFVMGWSMRSDKYCSWTDILPVTQGSVANSCYTPSTNTGYSIPVTGGGQRMLKPNFIQTTGSVGAYANKNVTVTHYGVATYLTTTDFQNYGNTFGILDSDSGIFTITQAGVYTISAHMHLKTNCNASSAPLEGQYFWDTVDGNIGLGIVNAGNTTDIFCGNFQPVIANKTTQIDLTTTRTVYLFANTQLGINVLNITGRTYTANHLNGSDGISLQIVKLSEDLLPTINL